MSDLEHIAIERLQSASEMSLFAYGQPLVITDSGGKDSSVVKALALRAGIPFEIMHNHTTADAPETVRFVRSEAKRFEDLGIKYTINMRWPKYELLYLNAFDKMLQERIRRGTDSGDMSWKTPKDVMNWYLATGILPGQMDLFDGMEEDE